MISIIVAMGKNNEIGKNNKMPWHLPNDLHYFKEKTTGHVVVMGRKTFESIGKPLPNRKNIVLTRQNNDLHNSVTTIHELNDINHIASKYKDKHIFILGGAEIYKQTIDMADHLFITQIDEAFEADAFFPQINPTEWKKVYEIKGEKDAKNNYDYTFLKFSRQ